MPTIFRRISYLLRRRRRDADLREELEFHRAMKQRDLEAAGHAPADAAHATARALGGQMLARDQVRDVWIWPWMQDASGDLRYAARALRRSPGFTLAVVLTLALGIGANTAIFSLLNAVLLRTLPVRDPQQLVFFGSTMASGSTGFTPDGATQLFSYRFFRDFRRETDAFSDVAAIASRLFRTSARVGSSAGLERVNVEFVSGSYFDTLGVPASVGRTLADADDQMPGGHLVAVVSYAWWQRRFGASPVALGSSVSVGERTYVIVGIAPPGFSGVTVGQAPDLWIPLAAQPQVAPGWKELDRPMFQTLHLIARLKPDLTRQQAQASTNLLFRNLLRTYLGAGASARTLDHVEHAYVDLTPAATGRSYLRPQFSSPLKILMAVVALVLLIACANVGNLLLARASAAQREMAVRMALGAGRLRIVRQLLAESVILGGLGALLGMVLASTASRLLVALVSSGTEPLSLVTPVDATVLTFTVAITLTTVALFGLVPALYITGLNLTPELKDGGAVTSSR